MKISKIHCSNIKSFDSVDAELSGFNVIVGMNGSGKSNFIMLLKIARDILGGSLAQAVSNFGGAGKIKNFYMPQPTEVVKYGFTLSLDGEIDFSVADKQISIREIADSFAFKDNCDCSFELLDENFILKLSLGRLDIKITAERDGDEYKYTFSAGEEDFRLAFPKFADFAGKKFRKSDSLLHAFFENVLGVSIRKSVVAKISVYEFEQELLSDFKAYRSAQEDDDSHEYFFDLLYRVLNDDDRRRSFYNFLNYILPDIEDVKIESGKKNPMFMVKERFSERYIPATLLSDGTIFLIVIILALYFDNKFITIFDEPERRIHPHILSKIIDMMKDASEKKQIILSTHNAEIVKYAGPDNIFLIKRNNHGNSVISLPGKNAEIHAFLQNDIGMDELFVQNMLK